MRRALILAVASFFFAPSLIAFGGGITIGPAWIALIQQEEIQPDWGSPWFFGVAPIILSWAIAFGVGSIIFTRSEKSDAGS